MDHGRDGPITILLVTLIIVVAIRPVGAESDRWACGRRLRQLEDAVRFGRGMVDDDSLQVLVELAHCEFDIVQRTFSCGLPIFVGSGNLLEGVEALLHLIFLLRDLLQGADLRLQLDADLRDLAIPLGVQVVKALLPLGVVLLEFVQDQFEPDSWLPGISGYECSDDVEMEAPDRIGVDWNYRNRFEQNCGIR